MIDRLETDSALSPADIEARVLSFVQKFKESGIIDLTGQRDTLATWLDEFEKHQIFIEADNAAHQDSPPHPDTISENEREALVSLRRTFPSQEDFVWRRVPVEL